MTKEEQIQVCDWFNTVFWSTYPGDLTRNKHGKRDNKGSKTYAIECMLKVPNIESLEEQKKIIGNLKAQIRYDRQDPESTRWPMVSSYVNRRRMYDEIESTAELKLSLEKKLCKCGQETVGPKYSECGKCLESHAARLKMMQHFERNRCRNARPVASGAFTELQGVSTDKRGIWEAIKHDDFLAEACKAWKPVEIEFNNMYWRKRC